MTARAVKQSDWHAAWSPKAPVEVTWAGGTDPPSYLSMDAAVARLMFDSTDPVMAQSIRESLESGKVRAGSFGIYRLLAAGPEAVPA